MTIEAGILLIYLAVAVAAGVMDLKTRKIPNWMIILELLPGFVRIYSDRMAYIENVVFTVLIFLMLIAIYKFVQKKGGILGGADVKVLPLVVHGMGTTNGLVAIICGLLICILFHSDRKKAEEIPIIFYVSIGCAVVVILRGVFFRYLW